MLGFLLKNALAFEGKRTCVLIKMHLRFSVNVKAFFIRINPE